jgi:hypothetical protein
MSKSQIVKHRRLRAAARALFAATLTAISILAAFGIAGESAPRVGTAHDDGNGVVPAKTYAGHRDTNLAQQ